MKKNYFLFLFSLLTISVTWAQVTLSQSVDPDSVTDGGVACWNNANGEYRENSFLRAYNLADFGITDAFEVTTVEYGQGAADDFKEITLNIYTATSDDLTSATLTLVGTATHFSLSSDDLTLISVPLSASIPANSTIAFEVLAGDSGTNSGETFFPGINAGGENDSSYLMSAACGINVPTTTATIGFADNQYVMNVVGNVLSVDEFDMGKISVTPNPATNFINIEIPNNSLNFVSELYDITGKQVLRKENTETLDVSQLKSGIYILRIKTDNGVVSRRIVKN